MFRLVIWYARCYRNPDWLTQNLSALSMLSCQNSFHTHHSTDRWPVVMAAGTLKPDRAETLSRLSATLRGLSWGDIQPEPRVAENWQGACRCDLSAQYCICSLFAITYEIFWNTLLLFIHLFELKALLNTVSSCLNNILGFLSCYFLV